MNKKLFISRAVKLVSFSLIFVLLFNYSFNVLSWKDGTNPYTSASTTLYEDLEDNIVDVLFLGSSHCYASVSNTYLWDEYGIGALNMVVSGQDLASSYYYMREVFKTQSPKLVCIELYGATFDKHAVTANIYRNALGLKYSDNFFGIVDAIAPEEQKKDYLLKWPIIHTRYRELQKEDFISLNPPYLGGHANGTKVKDIGELYVYNGPETLPISEYNEQWLQKIIDFADEQNTELMFFIVPYVAGENTHQKYRYIENLLSKKNIPVINYFDKIDELGINTQTDFRDEGHTNGNGAKKITSHIAGYLKTNYDLPDRHGDDRYKIWEENSIFLKRSNHNADIKNIRNTEAFFDSLSMAENYTVVISSSGNHISEDTDISEYFRKINADLSIAENGGSCIVENNSVIYSSSEENYSFYHDVKNGTVAVTGKNGVNQISVNRLIYNIVDNGYTVIVYDNITGEIADCIGLNAAKQYNLIR